MIKVHKVFFFILVLKSPFLNQAVLRALSEWRSSVQAAPMIVSELSSVCHCVDSGAGEDKNISD